MSPSAGVVAVSFLHTCLRVADAERSVAFYEQFGFERTWGFETDDGTENVYVADDEGVEIQFRDAPDREEFPPGGTFHHLAVGVDDLDATLDRIEHHGLERGPEDLPDLGLRIAFVRDPDGGLVELIQQLDE